MKRIIALTLALTFFGLTAVTLISGDLTTGSQLYKWDTTYHGGRGPNG